MTVTILDGGMGRELHRRGAPFRQPEWSALLDGNAGYCTRNAFGLSSRRRTGDYDQTAMRLFRFISGRSALMLKLPNGQAFRPFSA